MLVCFFCFVLLVCLFIFCLFVYFLSCYFFVLFLFVYLSFLSFVLLSFVSLFFFALFCYVLLYTRSSVLIVSVSVCVHLRLRVCVCCISTGCNNPLIFRKLFQTLIYARGLTDAVRSKSKKFPKRDLPRRKIISQTIRIYNSSKEKRKKKEEGGRKINCFYFPSPLQDFSRS